jgi:predicted alpha/beta-hydrolase family hydrolase
MTVLKDVELVLEGELSDNLVIFAHGAGANMHSDFMVHLSQSLISRGYQVLRFNFLYMQANMQDGKRRPPDRAPKLLAHFDSVLALVQQKIALGELKPSKIYLMGKSMGGRMAASLMMTAPESLPIAGVICLGYPFIPLKGGEPRLEPINECQVPVLIIQGDRDKFGTAAQAVTWPIKSKVQWCWLKDGDHSFVPRKSSGVTEKDNINQALEAALSFMQ